MAAKDNCLQAKIEHIRNSNLKHSEAMGIYNECALNYDDYMKSTGWAGVELLGKLVSDTLAGRKEVKIMDLAAGTGLVGIELHKHGFHQVDALDGSSEMLAIAESRHIYNRIICDVLGPNKLDIEDNTYDVVTICGGFSPGHADEQCLGEIIRIIKPGGYFVAAVIELTYARLPAFGQAMKDFEDKGIWRRVFHQKDIYHASHKGFYSVFQILP